MLAAVSEIAYDRCGGLDCPLTQKIPLLPAACLLTCLLCVFLILPGCGFNPAPVSSRPQPPSQRVTYHVVAPGETLFAIAWRYEKDLIALASSNGLPHPYLIAAGQRLTLDTSIRVPPNQASPKQVVIYPSKSGRPTSATSDSRVIKKSATIGKIKSVPKQAPGGKPIASYPKLPVGPVTWRWPVKGSVSRYYDTNKVFKGINIQSLPGRAVSAAANGVVVYAGNGLRGYGNLVIIKHSDIYLSAYAHNRTLSVREGDGVKAGTKISTVGGDVNNRGRLYFELRKNGKPVDPMRLLPRQ